MTCEIIQLSAARDTLKKLRTETSKTYAQQRREHRQALPESATETGRNQRMRLDRRDAWREAARLTEFWRAKMDWHSALSIAQSHNIADANSYPEIEHASRHPMVDAWRAAWKEQMLTPAPDVGAVNWKRAQLSSRNMRFAEMKPEIIERAIADDVRWLEAHPCRRSIAASRQSSKDDQ
jgi:hypothetical protein